MPKRTFAGTVVTRRVLIDSLTKGRTMEDAAEHAGFTDRSNLRRLARDEGISRRMLPCGVPCIEVRQ